MKKKDEQDVEETQKCVAKILGSLKGSNADTHNALAAMAIVLCQVCILSSMSKEEVLEKVAFTYDEFKKITYWE